MKFLKFAPVGLALMSFTSNLNAAPVTKVIGNTAPKLSTKVIPPAIKFLSLSTSSVEPIENVLGGEGIHVLPTAKNVKLSLVFNKPIDLKRVQIESCAAEWSDGIEVFTSPGQGRSFVEGGRKILDSKLNATANIESISFVFGRSQNLCLKNLRLFGTGDVALDLKSPSTLFVKTSGARVDRLFDSHPETQVAIEDSFTIKFSEVVKFDRAIVWTGGSGLFAHALKLKGEGGWGETLPLRNSSSGQEIIFKKPFSGQSMTVQAPDAGEIGELRFALATKVEAMRHDTPTTENELIRQKFAAAGFETLLDSRWTTTDEDKWTFLFRSDGTFFVRGFNDDLKQARDYSAVGSFALLQDDRAKLRLRINGVRFPTGLSWDGVSCPFACGSEGLFESSTSVMDSIVIEKSGEGSIIVRNRTPRAQRTITFGDLKLRKAAED